MKKLYLMGFLLISGCAEEECKPKGRYLIVTPFAGTTNRLRVLASANILAEVTKRKLVINWYLNPGEMPAQWNELFLNPLNTFEKSTLPEEGCTLEEITNAQAGDRVIKNLASLNDETGQKRIRQIPKDKEPIVYFGTSLNFWPEEKYIASADFWQKYRSFYLSLKPVGMVTKEVEQFKKDHFTNKFPIGVHYRAWAMNQFDDYVIRDLDNKNIPEFITKMKEALVENSGQDVVFFLSTDSQQVKDRLLAVNEFKGKIVTRKAKIERDTIQGQKDALVDWFLLASTNYIIGTSYSSFSDEPARITKQQRKINIGQSPFKK